MIGHLSNLVEAGVAREEAPGLGMIPWIQEKE
jgi:hypothetical protein